MRIRAGNPDISMTWALALIPTLALMHLCEIDTVVSQDIVMEMFSDSYDDKYEICYKPMEDKIFRHLYCERSRNEYFKKVWDVATKQWGKIKGHTKVPSGFRDEYAIATLAYTNQDPAIYAQFNQAVREHLKDRHYYLKNVNVTVLHYFLTRAVQMLKAEKPPVCYYVYRGTGARFSAKIGKEVRFGQFTSSSTKKTVADEFGTGTTFSITTCHGANIKHLSFIPDEEEVLIPPYEKFNVTDVRTGSGSNVITLVSVGTQSKYNCRNFEGKCPKKYPAAAVPPPSPAHAPPEEAGALSVHACNLHDSAPTWEQD